MVQLKLKTFITLFLLILGASNLFSQGLPRIRFTQIQQDTTFGSVLISSPTDSNISYSRNFFITADNILRFYDDTIPLKSYVDSVDATRFDSTQVINLVNDTATNIRNAIPIIISDSLVYYVSDTELNDSLATKLNTSFSNVTGTLPVANGGTGATTLTSGAFLKGNGTSAISGSSNLTETADTVFVAKYLDVDTSTLYVDAQLNRVGIGTTTPSQVLDVNGTIKVFTYQTISDTAAVTIGAYTPLDFNFTGPRNMNMRFSHNSIGESNSANVFMRRGRGTYESPEGVLNNDILGNLFFSGARSDGNMGFPAGAITGIADADATSTTNPVRISFRTGESFAALTERLTIKSDGKVGIGTTTPSQALEVNGVIESDGYFSTVDSNEYTGAWQVNNFNFTSRSDAIANMVIRYSMHSGFANNRAAFNFRRSRGTIENPTGVLNNDIIGDIAFSPYFSNGTTSFTSSISCFADGDATTTDAPTRLAFVTGTNAGNRTERLVIKSDGLVGIATTTPAYLLELPNVASNTGGRGRANQWAIYSDGRIKSNKKELPYGINDVMMLEPLKYYHHNSRQNNELLEILPDGETTIGFIAQDVLSIIPELVSLPSNYNKDLYSMDYAKLTVILTKAIQEQQAIIETQKQEIDTLKTSMQSQNEIIQQLISRIEALENN
jgi:hypothetical protein